MGVRGSNTCEIVLENVRVPRDNLLGDEKKGFSQFLYTLDGGRISIAALSVGIAQAAFEKALQFAKEREQFGQSISKLQAIQFKLADMAMEIEFARIRYIKRHGLKIKGSHSVRKQHMQNFLLLKWAFVLVIKRFKFMVVPGI